MDWYFVPVFVVAAFCILIDTISNTSRCYYRQRSWGRACRIWRSCWLSLIAEVDLGRSTTCWSITEPDFLSRSTRGRILYRMLWRIFWPSKVTAARSQDNSTRPVSPLNVSSVVMTSEETLGSLCFVKHESPLCAIVTISHFGCEMITCHISTCNTSQHGEEIWHRPRRSANGPLLCLCLLSVTLLQKQHNKAIKSGSRQQYKPLPITLTQCWYILIIFGGERAYRLSCTGQMETNHNNIEQGAMWPT